ncbi:MAG: response regulator [Thermoplasmata archaeon]|nr:response regulator [Thermoplasmata archaeon]
MTQLRYLIVDDSPTVRLTIKQALSQEKVPPENVSEAGTASDAVAAFDRTNPDVVFLDVTLTEGPGNPGNDQFLDLLNHPRAMPKSGNDVARYLRARNPSVTIVVCTGNAPDDPRVRELIKGGAFQLLQKPVHLAQIREVLRQVRDEKDAPGAAASAPP